VIYDARIELPLYDKELLFSEDYLERIVNKANQNQQKSWETIQKLTDKLDDIKLD
jgi:hypothetical protein